MSSESKNTLCIFETSLIFASIVVGSLGLQGTLTPKQLAIAAIAINSPVIALRGYDLIKSNNCTKKNQSTFLQQACFLSYFISIIAVSTLILNGAQISRQQLGWTIVGPILSIIGLAMVYQYLKDKKLC